MSSLPCPGGGDLHAAQSFRSMVNSTSQSDAARPPCRMERPFRFFASIWLVTELRDFSGGFFATKAGRRAKAIYESRLRSEKYLIFPENASDLPQAGPTPRPAEAICNSVIPTNSATAHGARPFPGRGKSWLRRFRLRPLQARRYAGEAVTNPASRPHLKPCRGSCFQSE